jgi:hypothetical protein
MMKYLLQKYFGNNRAETAAPATSKQQPQTAHRQKKSARGRWKGFVKPEHQKSGISKELNNQQEICHEYLMAGHGTGPAQSICKRPCMQNSNTQDVDFAYRLLATPSSTIDN